MTEMMDISGSIRKIALELGDAPTITHEELVGIATGASWLLNYIADGLDKELVLAAERGKWMQGFRKLNSGDHGESTVT